MVVIEGYTDKKGPEFRLEWLMITIAYASRQFPLLDLSIAIYQLKLIPEGGIRC